MEDLSYLDPPIEVSAESPRLEMILQRLRSSGMRPYRMESDVNLQCSDPLLIDVASTSRAVLQKCVSDTLSVNKRQIVMLHKGDNPISDPNVVWVSRDSDINLLPQRLISLSRRTVREREASLRHQTTSELGTQAELSMPRETPQLLYLGSGSPFFLDFKREMEKLGIPITAALSQSTAEEYLRDQKFTAVVLNLMIDEENPSSVLERNLAKTGEMTQLPVFVLLDKPHSLPDQFAKEIGSAAEVLATNQPMDILINQLASYTRKYALSQPFMPEPTPLSRITDYATGLYSREFLDRHVARQFDHSHDTTTPYCAISFRLKVPGDVATTASLKALADELRAQTRETDCAAVYDRCTLVATLPMTGYRGAVSLAKRIADSTYNMPDLKGLTVQWKVVERRAYHTAQTILGASVTGPFLKSQAA